ncbi:uncharacterized protein [Ptychodera flava]|uniref:uncharacterized protein n=1 Tax=Ptychodera flava TaxID=63121 RepID=UPI00396A5CE2
MFIRNTHPNKENQRCQTDNEPPIFNPDCPQSLTEHTDGRAVRNVNWQEPVPHDNSHDIILTQNFHPNHEFPIGTTEVEYTVKDTRHTVNCKFYVTIIDDEDPELDCVDEQSVQTDPGERFAVIHYQPGATDNSGEVTLSRDSEDGTQYVMKSSVIIEYTATDPSGNSASCSPRFTIFDGEKPSISCPGSQNVTTDPDKPNAVVEWLPPDTSDNSGENVNVTSKWSSGDEFPIGTTNVVLHAEDTTGNINSCSFDVTVRDEQLPEIECPSNFDQSTDKNENIATVHLPSPTWEWDNSLNWTVTGTLHPGMPSILPMNYTTVFYFISDSSNNEKSCSFNISIYDDEKPMFENCNIDIKQFTEPGLPNATVNWTVPTVTDNDRIADVRYPDKEPGVRLGIGNYTITYRATDASGNTRFCSNRVYVIDAEPPMLTCPEDKSKAINPGPYGNVAWDDPIVWDNSLEKQFPTWADTRPQLYIGTHEVTLFAKDSSGNIGNCTFTVTITADIHLVDGLTLREGRVQMYNNGAWETVCDEGWDMNDADVVCKELNFELGALETLHQSFYGFVNDAVHRSVSCTSSHTKLRDCPAQSASLTCTSSAGVICKSKVRLVGGTTPYEGNLQVYYNDEWGSVCDDGWDINDAKVACRELGFPNLARSITIGSYYGFHRNGPVWMSNLGCNFNEKSLLSCPSDKPHGVNNCSRSNIAGVICRGPVKLINGGKPHKGRLEVYTLGKWGTVCGDQFDIDDAHVVCRELGYMQGADSVEYSASFGKGTGIVWMSQVECKGYEASIFHCPSGKPLGENQCSHDKDVGITCVVNPVRLVGGYTPYDGRLEIWKDNKWGTVCKDGFGKNDSKVVCRQMGFSHGYYEVLDDRAYSKGIDEIWLTDVDCVGTETELFNCGHNQNTANCDHSMDVGVSCEPPIRLVSIPSQPEGTVKVQIFSDDDWKSIGCDMWDQIDADIVCTELGYTLGAESANCVTDGQSDSLWGNNVQCTSWEKSIAECRHEEHVGTSAWVAGLKCKVPEVRLVGHTPYEGRVEININGQWGTVGDSMWDITDADIVCRQLGFELGASEVTTSAFYGEGTGVIWLDNLDCYGGEHSIAFCPFSRPNSSSNYAHENDAGVLCQAPFRIVDGNHPYTGRVEVYMNEQWQRVCNTNWDNADAKVLCGELGFPSDHAKLLTDGDYTAGTGPAYMNDVACTGSETSLLNCPFSGNPDVSCQDATVECQQRVRLANGFSYFDGRVEVYHSGQWGLVCNKNFDENDADVVCIESGFPLGVDYIAPPSLYGVADAPIWMSNAKCSGDERTIWECPTVPLLVNDGCREQDDTNLQCKPPIQLVGTDVPYAGRVDVFLDKRWGTICNKGWDDTDASVLCAELGYPNGGLAKDYEPGTGPIWYEEFNCQGNEGTILDCIDKNEMEQTSCTHEMDAGAKCNSPTRLVDGPTRNAGRIEFFRNGTWAPICDDYFDINDGHVFCRELGFIYGASAVPHKSFYGPSPIDIVLDDMGCTGLEDTVLDCQYSQIPDCGPEEGASLICIDDPVDNFYWSMDNVPAETHGTIESVDGLFNSAIHLEGEGQWLDLGTFPESCFENLDSNCINGITVSLWLKTGEMEDKQVILLLGSEHLYGMSFAFRTDKYEVTVRQNDTLWSCVFVGEFDEWRHVVISWINSDGLQVFVDGYNVTEDMEGSFAEHRGFFGSTGNIHIGKNEAANGKLAEIDIDELEVTGKYTEKVEPHNLAINKPSYMSTVSERNHRFAAAMAVDGIIDTYCETAMGDVNPYLQIDLGRKYGITHAVISSADLSQQSLEFHVGDTWIKEDAQQCGPQFDLSPFQIFTVFCSESMIHGQFVYVSIKRPTEKAEPVLKVSEVQVFSDPAYLGCVEQTNKFSKAPSENERLSIGECRHECSLESYAYSALNDNQDCFCSGTGRQDLESGSGNCRLYFDYSENDFTVQPKTVDNTQLAPPTQDKLSLYKAGSIFRRLTKIENGNGLSIDVHCASHPSNSFRVEHREELYLPNEVIECSVLSTLSDYNFLFELHVDFNNYTEPVVDQVWAREMYYFNISYRTPGIYSFNTSVDHFVSSGFVIKQIEVTMMTSPILGRTNNENIENDFATGLQIESVNVTEEKLAIVGMEQYFSLFLIDGNDTTCQWYFGDGENKTKQLKTPGFINVSHSYGYESRGLVTINAECCNFVDCANFSFTRYLKTALATFEPTPPFTIEEGNPAIVEWETKPDAEVNMMIQMDHDPAQSYDYHRGNFSLEKNNYECQGKHTVFMTVSNPPQQDILRSTFFISQQSINGVTLDFQVEYLVTEFKSLVGETDEILKEIEVYKNLTVNCSTYGGSDVFRILTFGDEETNTNLTNPGLITFFDRGKEEEYHVHMYTKKGHRKVEMIAVNEHTLFNQSYWLDVYTLCDKPQVWINGHGKSRLSPRIHHRSEVLLVTSLVTYNCRDNDTDSTFEWFVTSSGKETRIETSKKFSVSFESKYFDYGIISVRLVVTLSFAHIEPGSDTVYIQITRASPIAYIEGGTARSHSRYLNLVLDASKSDDPESETNNFNLSWSCHLSDESPAELSWDIERSFAKCGIGISSLNYTSDMRIVTIDSLSLTVGKYTFSVKICTYDEVERTFQQNVAVVDSFPPDIEIKCILNCGDVISSSQTTSFELLCGSCTLLDVPIYSWQLIQCENDAESCTNVEHFSSFTVTGVNSSSLVISEDSLEKKTNYRLKGFVNVLGQGEAFSIYSFRTASPPYGGHCEMIPQKGVALVTMFLGVCLGWQTGERVEDDTAVTMSEINSPGLYYRFQLFANGQEYASDFYYAMDSLTPNMSLPEAPAETNYFWDVVVSVENRYGEMNTTFLQVQVTPLTFDRNTIESFYKKADIFKRLVNPIQATQMILTISALLNKWCNETADKDMKAELIKLRTDISDLWDFSTDLLLSPESVSQSASSLVYSTTIPDQVDKRSQQSTVTALHRSSNEMFSMTGTDENFPQTKVLRTAKDLVTSVASLLVAVNPPRKTETVEVEKAVNSTDDNDTVTHVSTEQATAWKQVDDPAHVRSTTNAIVESVGSLSDGVLRRMVPNEPPVNFTSNGVAVQLERTTSGDMANKTLQFSRGTFAFASTKSMFGEKNYSSVDIKAVEYERNPFIWDKTADLVRSPIISVELMDGANATVIDQKEKQEDFVFTMDYVREEDLLNSEKIKNYTNADNETVNQVAPEYYTFNVSGSGTAVTIMITPNGTNATYIIYLRHRKFPFDDKYDFKYVIPPDLGIFMDNLTYNHLYDNIDQCDDCPKVPGYARNTSMYEVFIPSTHVKRAGMYYMKIKEFVEWNETSGIPLIDEVFTPYSVRIHTATCRYWNTKREKWLTDGCKVSPLSLPNETICQCNHLTSFGVDSFYVPINPINWEEVLVGFHNFLDNSLVFAVIVTILIIYFILVYFAHKKDKEDIIRWSATSLLDNREDDEYKYHMTVYTGFHSGAGTTSNIFFRLKGSEGETENRRLKDDYSKVFSSGSVNHFILSVPRSLGQLEHIYVWHDSAGLGDDASWYLDRIVLGDLQRSQWHCFVCDEWLAVDKADGKIDRLLSIAPMTSLTNFSTLFGWRRQKSLTDDHLWFSVFLRPNWSEFTRVQRLSCCLSLLFAYLISNAMFYKTDNEQEKENYTWIVFGPIKFSLQQIYIGTISGLVIVPINVIVVQIFRKAKRRKGSIIIRYIKSLTQRKNKADCSSSEINITLPENEEVPIVEGKKRKRRKKYECKLPWWFLYIGWFCVFLTTTVSASFVIIYSMMWKAEKSADWLLSVTTSFAESILLMEPFQAIMLAALISMLIRRPDKEKFQKIAEDSEDDLLPGMGLKGSNEHYESGEGNPNDPAKEPLKAEELVPIRQRRAKEKKMVSVFYGILIYSVFIAITFLICNSLRDSSTNIFNQHLKTTLLESKPPFKQIRRPDQIWSWIDEVIIPNLYPPTGENDSEIVLADNITYRVGFPRLRQQRVRPRECVFTLVNFSRCESGVEDRHNYDVGWQSLSNQDNSSSLYDHWHFMHATEMDGTTFFGQYGSYDTSGYSVVLQGNRSSVLTLLESLKNDSWIDLHSRVVLLEFDLYSPNSNLFCSCMYTLEFLSNGVIEGKAVNSVFRLINGVASSKFVYDKDAVIVFVCWVCYGCFMVYMAYAIMKRVKLQKFNFLKIPWNYFDVALVLTMFLGICAAIVVEVVSADIMENTVNGSGTNLQSVSILYDGLLHILSLVVFFGIIRYLKLLRFNKRMYLLSMTLKHAGPGLVSFLMLLVVTFGMFVHSGHLMFYIKVDEFKNLHASITYLFTVMLGKFPKVAGFEMAPGIWRWYLFMFWLVENTLTMNIFIAIISEAFTTARIENTKQQNYFEMIDYLTLRVKDKAMAIGLIRGKKIDADKNDEFADRIMSSFRDVLLKLDRVEGAIDKLGARTQSIVDKYKVKELSF